MNIFFFARTKFDLSSLKKKKHMSEEVRFDEMNLQPDLMRGVFTYGWEKASDIQKVGIPLIMSGTDVVIQAPSGTGKTGTFGVGLIHRCLQTGMNGLVICPSRELAIQSSVVLDELAKYCSSIAVICAVGGHTRKSDNLRMLRDSQNSVLVATPGRLLDILTANNMVGRTIGTTVLDECDELLRDGEQSFQSVVQKIFGILPRDCSVALVSATMNASVERLAKMLLNNPSYVVAEKPSNLVLSGIRQYKYTCSTILDKIMMLERIYRTWTIGKAVIFCATKDRVDWLGDQMESRGFSVGRLHSQLSDEDRIESMRRYRNGMTRVLISTHVIARGIDVQNVQLVVQFDLICDTATYLHAIGRCGRYGRKGVAVAFVTDEEQTSLASIEQFYSVKTDVLPETLQIPGMSMSS